MWLIPISHYGKKSRDRIEAMLYSLENHWSPNICIHSDLVKSTKETLSAMKFKSNVIKYESQGLPQTR